MEKYNLLGSKGIEAIGSKKISAERNPGFNWNLKMFNENPTLVPYNNIMFKISDGTVSMHLLDGVMPCCKKMEIEGCSLTRRIAQMRQEGTFSTLCICA